MSATLATWQKQAIEVNGVRTVVLSAGDGPPLVYFHGASVFPGFDYQLAWADRFRVLIPHHPGFGESADDPSITCLHDYVMHYLELFERLGLGSQQVNLVGHSLGGWLAAWFAAEHGPRFLRKLVLVSPAGLRDREHPTLDVFRIPSEELPPYLVANPAVLAPHLPSGPDVDFTVERYRESSNLARVLWERPYDLRLPRYLYRVRAPTLLVWGEQDRLIPVEQAAGWQRLIPGAEVRRLPDVGHLVVEESPRAVEDIAQFLAA